MNPNIIGAGIGGLTTAIALNQKGIQSSIYEQTEEIKPVGAGIILANNAMQVYKKLGLKEEIEIAGNPISSMNITTSNLKPISKIDLKYFEHKFGVKNIAIHRGKLQNILASKLPKSQLNLNKKLIKIDNNKSCHLNFEDGSQYQADVLIGADGINSMVRKELFEEVSIRRAKQICWRGLVDFQLPYNYVNELNEAWGHGARFGFVQIDPRTVYWYALKPFKNSIEEYSITNIPQYFEQYHPIIQEIIDKTAANNIHTNEIADLKPFFKWSKKKAVLIGDAAHATTPNMGQGACQAIEDAYILSECLSSKPTVEEAFLKYQTIRIDKAYRVVNTSWKLGKLAHLKNPIISKLRNIAMGLTPAWVNRLQSERIFELCKL